MTKEELNKKQTEEVKGGTEVHQAWDAGVLCARAHYKERLGAPAAAAKAS